MASRAGEHERTKHWPFVTRNISKSLQVRSATRQTSRTANFTRPRLKNPTESSRQTPLIQQRFQLGRLKTVPARSRNLKIPIPKYSKTLRRGKIVSTGRLFWNAIGYSTWMGTVAIEACAVIYSTFIFPVLGTIIGARYCLLLGLLLGLGNGIIVGIVTRLWFFPLTNPKFYRQALTVISIILCTSTSIVFFLMLPLIRLQDAMDYIIFALAPSLIAGMSMGASSKSIARWYQKESGL